MKVKYTTQDGAYRIVTGIGDAAIDPEATKHHIASLTTPEMTKQQIDQLFTAHAVYAKPGPGGELIDDAAGEAVREQLAAKGANRELLDSGGYVSNFRGVEYWVKQTGRWGKESVGEIGTAVPAGAVLPEGLTEEQRREIAGQEETDRVAALTPEERAGEQIAVIQAKLAEIDQLDGPRPIREAVKAMVENAGLDTPYLMQHEDEAVARREQLAALAAQYA
jgi:hypothetical protein